jgi:hypothetical protein
MEEEVDMLGLNLVVVVTNSLAVLVELDSVTRRCCEQRRECYPGLLLHVHFAAYQS